MFLSGRSHSFTALVEAISHPRLGSYRTFFSTSDDGQTLGLYQWNEDASGAVFRALSMVEIVLRNQFHKILGARYGGAGARGWFNHLALPSRSLQAVKEITHRRRGTQWIPRVPAPSPDDVVSKLSFGFWPHLLDVTQDTAGNRLRWDDLLVHILPGHRQRQAAYWARQSSRDAFFARMDLCNEIRNRIAHHEPIWKLGPLMSESRARLHSPPIQLLHAPGSPKESVERLQLYYSRLTELLKWLSPALSLAYHGSEMDARCKMLLTERALEHYRHRLALGTAQISQFAGRRKLRKMLKYAARRRQPLALLDGNTLIGHWIGPHR